MKPPTHLNAPSEALRRVFLPSPHEPYKRIPALPLHPRPSHRPLLTTRLQSTLPNDTRPRDRQIGSRLIYLVDPSDQRLSTPQSLGALLSTLPLDTHNQPTQYIQQVAPPTPTHPYPICRVVDKAAARAAEDAVRKKEKEKAREKAKVQEKTLEVGWSVSDNDLGHRMVRLREWLGKGWRVEVVFGSKRKSGWGRKRAVSVEEAEGLVEKIRGVVGEVEGAREQRAMEGRVGEEAVLYFEGKAKARGGEGVGD
ncbi:hypothetical protein BDR22DRAFT_969251 [Usnea florida]